MRLTYGFSPHLVGSSTSGFSLHVILDSYPGLFHAQHRISRPWRVSCPPGFAKLNNRGEVPLLGPGCYDIVHLNSIVEAILVATHHGHLHFDTVKFYQNEGPRSSTP